MLSSSLCTNISFSLLFPPNPHPISIFLLSSVPPILTCCVFLLHPPTFVVLNLCGVGGPLFRGQIVRRPSPDDYGRDNPCRWDLFKFTGEVRCPARCTCFPPSLIWCPPPPSSFTRGNRFLADSSATSHSSVAANAITGSFFICGRGTSPHVPMIFLLPFCLSFLVTSFTCSNAVSVR